MMQPSDESEATSRQSSLWEEHRKIVSQEDVRKPSTAPVDKTTATTTNSDPRDLAAYDPFSPNRPRTTVRSSLLDTEEDEDTESDVESSVPQPTTATVPGVAGFLEMEQEPPRSPAQTAQNSPPAKSISPYEPIKTSSGLLLTHRRTPAEMRASSNQLYAELHQSVEHEDDDEKKRQGSTFRSPSLKRNLYRERLEVENPWSSMHHSGGPSRGALWQQGQRLLSLARIWILLSALVLLIGTTVLIHHMRHEVSPVSSAQQEAENTDAVNSSIQSEEDGPIVLLPLPNAANGGVVTPQHEQHLLPLHYSSGGGGRRLVATETLRSEFETWVLQHGKVYHSHEEKEARFQIWTENHHRTSEKNERHGPCKLTNQPVFGSNHFKDLSPDEFKARYLTGYTGPRKDKEPASRNAGVLGPHITTSRHPDVHRRIQASWEQGTSRRGGVMNTQCKWYDMSCLLSFVFTTYFYGLGGTMEPAYDSDSYPTAVDWRDIGAVTEVHTQGNCGACWAITAVETVESAVFISSGTLHDLSETEVIVCEEECQMCEGGWPQNAFEYVMDQKGVPLESDLAYDGDFLLTLSTVKAGESDEMDEDEVQSYVNAICPGGGGNSHSGDNDGGEGSNYDRYGGDISGYGYATEKCVCYTDGTGCDCDSQNEGMAVRNVATYGPAVVCFDASTWQDYAGGVITADSGCSASFFEVNHCAQVVGYAYTDGNEAVEGAEQENQNSHDSGSGSGSGSKDSRDDGTRAGYWIVRNQWSSYWGMNGYAYVAMGDNTCGILNDMLVAYA